MQQGTATHATRFGASSHGHGGTPERRISAESDTSSFGFSPRKAGGRSKRTPPALCIRLSKTGTAMMMTTRQGTAEVGE